tara:strand:+ start:8036 stop:8329 length:294 start_codon:yes stop_codon:yes gene_type:complete
MSKKISKKKVVPELWSVAEKLGKCLEIRKKLEEFSLKTVYPKEIQDLDAIINNYIRNDKEYTGSIPLPGTQRLLVIKLRNNKKWPPQVVISYNPNAK